MNKVIFKHPDQAYIYPKLLNALNRLCIDFKKNLVCVSGYRSLENQKATNTSVLKSTPGAKQRADGSVYSKDGKCLAAAYGKSNHCFCIAMDIEDSWFKMLKNEQLKRYGLIKPMDYEPWHVQLIEHSGISESQKIKIRDSVLKGVVKSNETIKVAK